MSKHTPGPWEWHIEDYSMASLGVGDDPGLGDPLVLAIGPCRSCQAWEAERATREKREAKWKWGRCHTPSEADARLIAAAPEMKGAGIDALDALEKAAAALCADPLHNASVAASIELAIRNLRAAIAKAEEDLDQ